MMTRTPVLAALALACATFLDAAPAKPKSVIHVITLKWAPGASEAAIQKAIQGVETMNYPGLTRVWTRPIKKQLQEGYTHIIVMEFESEAALKSYADSPAQKKWYEVYMPVRGESRTHDITN
jgi:hypothetical protein